MKHFRCCIFKDKFLNEEQRKSNEMDMVNFLNINYFKCLNVYVLYRLSIHIIYKFSYADCQFISHLYRLEIFVS